MKYRNFGTTDLRISEVGFGAWGIGGPSMAGSIPIGLGKVDDNESILALKRAGDEGINFFDTADFYGLGHSEELIGKVYGNNSSVIIATKVGHKLVKNDKIALDYSYDHIIESCNNSLKRLKRDQIDYYQLHTAKLSDLEKGECIEAMEYLKKEGKIRYWGLSLNTFNPLPEAEFMMNNKLGSGLQVVFNIINQRANDIINRSSKLGMGIIARMPLQFGLLTGRFNNKTSFPKNDHRAFRLTSEMLNKAMPALDHIWPIADKQGISKGSLALSFIMNFESVSTVIPGIKTEQQVIENARSIHRLPDEVMAILAGNVKMDLLMDFIEKEEMANS